MVVYTTDEVVTAADNPSYSLVTALWTRDAHTASSEVVAQMMFLSSNLTLK